MQLKLLIKGTVYVRATASAAASAELAFLLAPPSPVFETPLSGASTAAYTLKEHTVTLIGFQD